MTPAQIKSKIEEYEIIRSKTTEQSQIDFCNAKINRLSGQLELTKKAQKQAEEAEKKAKKKAEKAKVPYVDDMDYDFEGRKPDKHIINAKKRNLKKSILDDFTDLF